MQKELIQSVLQKIMQFEDRVIVRYMQDGKEQTVAGYVYSAGNDEAEISYFPIGRNTSFTHRIKYDDMRSLALDLETA